MAQSNGPRRRLRRRRKKVRESDTLTNREKRLILDLSFGIDGEELSHTSTVDDKAASTNQNYVVRLRKLAEAYDGRFDKISQGELKRLLSDFAEGNHPDVSEDGYATGTMTQFQSAAKALIRHHNLPLDADDIPVSSPERGSQAVDERDMFDNDDIEAMREAIDNPRDECLFELLLNTGQRIRAIQTLRVKDVDVSEGVYWLNTDEVGLKGAEKVGQKRPLLGAVGAVKKWLEYHPTGKSDDYLLTARVDNNKATPGEMMAQQTLRARLKKIAERADVTKPVNPHNFRHSFVTMCKRDYNMDDSTVKFLIGHASDSTVMETTYQHLTDDDHIKDAEVAMGRREPEEPSTVGRTQCPNPDCLNELDPTDKACNSCGTIISPDAKAAQDTVKASVRDAKDEADTLEEHKDLDKLERLIDENPELIDVLESMAGE
ncbi:MAG: tyrosine-type recombinase/integrase [Halobacteriaceae archaeon]